MKKHCVRAVGLLVVVLFCLPVGFRGYTHADSLQEKFILLITNTEADNVVAYSQVFSGEIPFGVFISTGTGGLDSPDTMVIGPDGRLYISSGTTPTNSAILRFDANGGTFIDVFASGGGLLRPYGAVFGPDGFSVASFLSDQILRYDSTTGAFVDVFAAGNALPGGLNGPDGLAFGPDGKL